MDKSVADEKPSFVVLIQTFAATMDLVSCTAPHVINGSQIIPFLIRCLRLPSPEVSFILINLLFDIAWNTFAICVSLLLADS